MDNTVKLWEVARASMSSSNPNSYVAVVDDDDSVCRSFSRLLRAAGYQPVSYSSAEGFLEDTKRPRFDCLVLDIQLEGITGLELRRRLAAVNDATPVVFITAHDNPAVRAEAEASGCAGYFSKADPGAAVLEAIRKAVTVSSHQMPNPNQLSNIP
ncbi:MAG: response regulator [Verrucomicrobia bacterium]|nr:response regulator [Verrucomicrobiota bacterium]